jgi:dTDP-4-amino-4,6-dideoxygalactose transaminase
MADYSVSSDLLLGDVEKSIAQYMDTKYAIVCASARSAIRYSLLALGIGSGDEVIVSDLVPQELPITVFCTGAKPRLCDVDRQTCAISLESFQNALQRNTKAVIFSQLYGLPADPSPIKEVAERREIKVIEDSSQALGANINGRKVGTSGDAGIINFNKFLDIPLGAAIVTSDEELALKIRSIKAKYETRSIFTYLCNKIMLTTRLNTKKINQLVFLSDKYLYKLMHEILEKKCFNITDGWIKATPYTLELWRSNSLTPSMISQLIARADGRYWQRRRLEKVEILHLKKELIRLEEYMQIRKKIANIYDNSLSFKGFEKIPVPDNSSSALKKYPIVFANRNKSLKCQQELSRIGVRLDYRYRPLHLSPFIEDTANSDFKNAIYLSENLLPLPVAPNMHPDTVKKIARIINQSV